MGNSPIYPARRPIRSSAASHRTTEGPMKRTWTIIGLADVHLSFSWSQSLLGLPETTPAHDYFGQIVDSDGTVLLCLHAWGAHGHPSLTSPHYAKPGNGPLVRHQVGRSCRLKQLDATQFGAWATNRGR